MEEQKRTGTRLNKYLSEAGVCSRREADQAIEAGEVMIDGRVAVLGDRVQEGETVIFREEVVEHKEPEVLLLLNKPKGIVCTAEKKEKNNIVDYMNYPVRIYPVGRLDKDSRGLILLTNQGDLVNKLNRAGNYHEKEYVVRIDQEVTAEFLEKLQRGIFLPELKVKTRPCKAWKVSYDTFHIVLTQGLNRQIRRMCEALHCNVKDLCRIRIMNLKLGDLEEGAYRELTEEEKKTLIDSLQHSYSAPKQYRPRKKFYGGHSGSGYHRDGYKRDHEDSPNGHYHHGSYSDREHRSYGSGSQRGYRRDNGDHRSSYSHDSGYHKNDGSSSGRTYRKYGQDGSRQNDYHQNGSRSNEYRQHSSRQNDYRQNDYHQNHRQSDYRKNNNR